MVNELGLDQAKGQKFPMQPGYYRLECADLLETNKDYRKVIGRLLYVSTNTRPDISTSVNILAQRVETPRKLDMQEALRVVKNLSATKDHILHLNRIETEQSLIAYSDANYGV